MSYYSVSACCKYTFVSSFFSFFAVLARFPFGCKENTAVKAKRHRISEKTILCLSCFV